jgi:predicted hotdog family 3-hydroxylacyl-ACP dehydratase
MAERAAAVQLGAEGIAALIPHRGRMCLLDGLLDWDAEQIRCRASGHQALDHPLRTAHGLLATAAIEYAAQAMALHGGLLARAAGGRAAPGFLASARAVRLHRLRLDDLTGPLLVLAQRQAGDDRQILYRFQVEHDGAPVVDGRAAVILNTPLPR